MNPRVGIVIDRGEADARADRLERRRSGGVDRIAYRTLLPADAANAERPLMSVQNPSQYELQWSNTKSPSAITREPDH
jgi:hypothetical protein